MPRHQKLKLTAVQRHKVTTASRELSGVLREVKSKPLKGKPLEAMQTLESALQHLEVFNLETA